MLMCSIIERIQFPSYRFANFYFRLNSRSRAHTRAPGSMSHIKYIYSIIYAAQKRDNNFGRSEKGQKANVNQEQEKKTTKQFIHFAHCSPCKSRSIFGRSVFHIEYLRNRHEERERTEYHIHTHVAAVASAAAHSVARRYATPIL